MDLFRLFSQDIETHSQPNSSGKIPQRFPFHPTAYAYLTMLLCVACGITFLHSHIYLDDTVQNAEAVRALIILLAFL